MHRLHGNKDWSLNSERDQLKARIVRTKCLHGAYAKPKDKTPHAHHSIPETGTQRPQLELRASRNFAAHVVSSLPKAHAGIKHPSTVSVRVTCQGSIYFEFSEMGDGLNFLGAHCVQSRFRPTLPASRSCGLLGHPSLSCHSCRAEADNGSRSTHKQHSV